MAVCSHFSWPEETTNEFLTSLDAGRLPRGDVNICCSVVAGEDKLIILGSWEIKTRLGRKADEMSCGTFKLKPAEPDQRERSFISLARGSSPTTHLNPRSIRASNT